MARDLPQIALEMPSEAREVLGSLGRMVDPYELTDFDDLRLGKPGEPRGRALGFEERRRMPIRDA